MYGSTASLGGLEGRHVPRAELPDGPVSRAQWLFSGPHLPWRLFVCETRSDSLCKKCIRIPVAPGMAVVHLRASSSKTISLICSRLALFFAAMAVCDLVSVARLDMEANRRVAGSRKLFAGCNCRSGPVDHLLSGSAYLGRGPRILFVRDYVVLLPGVFSGFLYASLCSLTTSSDPLNACHSVCLLNLRRQCLPPHLPADVSPAQLLSFSHHALLAYFLSRFSWKPLSSRAAIASRTYGLDTRL